ncbi:MAG TPA: signal recognition particle-docking protein FtsY [Candidatus Nanoarchaeia archaeon]|nr:signal recognition particle-docking protein FtsY [Candidatus Nanoarchaeia archaeon]
MFDILRKKFSAIVKKTVKEVKKAVKTVPEKKQKKEKSVKKEKKSKKEAKKVKDKVIEQVEELKEEKHELVAKQEIIEIKEEENILETGEEIQEEKSSFGFFSKIKSYLTQSKLTKKQFEEAFEELEIILLENNVALEAVDAIKMSLEQQLVDKEIKPKEIENTILESLKNAILSVIKEPSNLLEAIKEKKEPFVILFFGINGTGKTTSVAKIASYLKDNNISSVMAAADTFRAAAIEQLKTHSEKIQVPIIAGNYGADPAAVAFDAIQYAKKHNIKCVLIDTAGRMYTKDNLLREMHKIVRVSKPDLKLFVGESITGNDATEQTRTFNDSIGIDGIILTKADIDEKAGTILSVSQVTGKPIYFLGTGQNYKDLEPFTKQTVLKNLGLS